MGLSFKISCPPLKPATNRGTRKVSSMQSCTAPDVINQHAAINATRIYTPRRSPFTVIAAVALLGFPSSSDAQGLPNIALNAVATASATLSGSSPALAVDGDFRTFWSAGAVGPQWIEISLPGPSVVQFVKLSVAQSPAGITEHTVRLIENDQSLTLGVRTEFTTDGQQLTFSRPHVDDPTGGWPAFQGPVTKVRIETTSSTSWVAWREIEVIGFPSKYSQTSNSTLLSINH